MRGCSACRLADAMQSPLCRHVPTPVRACCSCSKVLIAPAVLRPTAPQALRVAAGVLMS